KDYVDGQVTAVRNIANGKWTWNQAQIDGRVTAISYTKAQSDAAYMPRTGAYTKAESDGRYALKGSVSTTGNGGDVGQFILAKMSSRDTSFNGVYTADGRYPLVITDINGNEEHGRTIQAGNWKRLSGGDKRSAALWVRVS
ncbi:hypothetical protein JJQ13_27260, partial [Enterobacter hormaechei]|nr:hypothetical protein [Enterobacter hormaechei]